MKNIDNNLEHKNQIDILIHSPKKTTQQQNGQPIHMGIIIFCIAIYLGIIYLQAIDIFQTTVNGVLAQFLVIISVYLTASRVRTGFLVGLSLNIINLIAILLAVLVEHNEEAITGLVVSLSTIVSISIIGVLTNRNARQFSDVVKQKQEMALLNEEIAASQEELRQQNEQLKEYYQTIKKNEAKLNYLAYFDALTELPNRKMLLDRLDLLVNESMQRTSLFAVVFIDLDNFKKINDTMGHHIGDLVIESMASRLNSLVDENDILGRLGGDEFALIIQRELKHEEIFQYLSTLKNCLEQSLSIENFEIKISASFGISSFPQDGNSPGELMKCADTAMYKAKEMGKNGICFFRKEMRNEIIQKIDFENKLAAALKNEEFFLVFQPQFDVRSGKLKGFEALIRWRTLDQGIMNPSEFIPMAEEMGLMIPMGEWILRTACQKFKKLLEQYQVDDAVISVNISVGEFENPAFVAMIGTVLKDCGVKACNLELEITESILSKSLKYAIQIMSKLKEMGIRIALDNFGAGYSSLRNLQLLPIDTLKIDKSFVHNINSVNEGKQIVGSIISLVHSMGVSVTAEGVESESQLDYLKKANCDKIQGFLLGHPMNSIELQKFFDQYSGSL